MTALPSLRQLRYLVALAQERHFGRAAQACNVTQSTLSAGIQELEATLGVTLAERTKRSVIITTLGETIVMRSKAILRSAEDLVDCAAAAGEMLTGDLRLGVIPTVGPYLLPRALPNLRQSYPGLRLYLREDRTDRLLAHLGDGRLDAALMAFPYPVDAVDSIEIAEDRFLFACHRDHPLALRKAVTDADLAATPLMLLEEGHCLRGHALAACSLTRRTTDDTFEATSLQTLIQMVSEGLGATLIPELAADSGTLGDDIALVPLVRPATRRIGLAWRKTSGRVADFHHLARSLADALAKA